MASALIEEFYMDFLFIPIVCKSKTKTFSDTNELSYSSAFLKIKKFLCSIYSKRHSLFDR